MCKNNWNKSTRRVNDTLIMRQKTSKGGMARCLLITLISAVCLIAISSSPVFAYSFERYLTLDYDIGLSRTNISESRAFYAIIEGTATCKRNLPVRITEGYITSHVVAEHQESRTEVVLNSSYTMYIEPFPSRIGESTQFSALVALEFPSGSEPGTYNIEARIIKAEVDTTVGWIEVTSSLPSSEAIGTVDYTPTVPLSEAVKAMVIEAPAFFTTSNLSTTPAEVDMGEEVTISVLITNSGDLSGSHQVTLNIDGVAVATKELTLAGGTSARLTFTTTQDIPGTYSVAIDDLSGTFDVKLVLAKMTNWWLIAAIAGASTTVAVPLATRRRRRL